MISNIEKYASLKAISRQDALQAFMQAIVLKNLQLGGISLIGGTSLVIGYNNPRFSEDIDLTGVGNPNNLLPHIEKAKRELEGLLDSIIMVTHPKKNRGTWRISCKDEAGLSARLHIDTQPYPSLSSKPIMVEYPGIAAFVCPSVELSEIMADKLVALAFRKNVSGRDIFDLWYHWLKEGNPIRQESAIFAFVLQKLIQRKLEKAEFNRLIKTRMAGNAGKKVEAEWERYLPAGLRSKAFYEQVFSTVKKYLCEMEL